MKINVHGPLAGTGWDGMIHSWHGLVEVDDANPKAVAWARYTVNSGAADLIEDVKPKEPAKPETSARTEAEPAARRGRPPLPRDAAGNVIRE